MSVNQFQTMTEALEDLRKRGYKDDVLIENNKAHIPGSNVQMDAQDMSIVEYHRFEGNSDSDDMAVVYAVESNNGSRGVIIDAYGTYSNAEIGDFLKSVKLANETT